MEIIKSWLPLVTSIVALGVAIINWFSNRQLLREKTKLELEAKKTTDTHLSKLKQLENTLDHRGLQTRKQIDSLISAIKALQSCKDNFSMLADDLASFDYINIENSLEASKSTVQILKDAHGDLTSIFPPEDISSIHNAKNSASSIIGQIDHAIRNKSVGGNEEIFRVHLLELNSKLSDTQMMLRDQRDKHQYFLIGTH